MNNPKNLRAITASHVASDSFFRELNVQEKERLLQDSQVVYFRKNEVIFEDDEPGHVMYFIQAGLVNLVKPDLNGKELILATLHLGEFFGEMALLDDLGRSCRAAAATDVTLASISKTSFLAILTDHPRLLLKLVSVLSLRLRETDRKLEEMVFGRVGERLEKMLLDLSAGEKAVKLGMTHKQLGDKLGVCRETVTRSLKALENEGWKFI